MVQRGALSTHSSLGYLCAIVLEYGINFNISSVPGRLRDLSSTSAKPDRAPEKWLPKVVFTDCLAVINQWGDFSEDRYREVDILISPFITFEKY